MDNSSFSHQFDLISCRQAGLGATPEGLLTKVEEEVKVREKSFTHFLLQYFSIEGERVHCEGEIAEGVRGANIEQAANPEPQIKSYGNQVRRAAVSSLQRVLSQPAMGQVSSSTIVDLSHTTESGSMRLDASLA